MRIISQSGRIDIPYEVAAVYVEYESIIAKVGDERYAMGSYSTEEKAFKVMEMLRELFLKFSTATNRENFYEFFDEPKVYQFPQDDEIEV